MFIGVPGGLLLFIGTVAVAGDRDLVLHEDRLAPSSGGYHYGSEVATADLNADGFFDAVISSPTSNRVFVTLGTPDGLDPSTETVLTNHSTSWGDYGYGLAAADFDGDGYADIAVGEDYAGLRWEGGGVWLFAGGPSGADPDDPDLLLPVTPTNSTMDSFGHALSAGDLDGDGFADLVIGAEQSETEAGIETGSAYIYYGSEAGLDSSTEVVLTREDGQDWDSFGFDVAAAGDMDGDGVQEVAVVCYGSHGSKWNGLYYYPCATVYVFSAAGGTYGDLEPIALQPNDVDWEDFDTWNWYGWRLDGAGDFDQDGYADLAVGSRGGAYLYRGGATEVGPDPDLLLRNPARTDCDGGQFGFEVARGGDVDGDGFDDLLATCDSMPPERDLVFVFFGSASGISGDDYVFAGPDHRLRGDGIGPGLAAGDFNGDGRSDMLVGDYTGDNLVGEAWTYRPVCDWYRDADGDGHGHGDPNDHLSTCSEPGGYADNDNDCDDGDAEVQGRTWYADEDGDGWGTMGGAILACEQPEGTSESWLDCDDGDAAVYPGANGEPGDGIDQDCDGNDAESPAPGDTGSTDSGAIDTPPRSQGPELGELTPGRSGCGCASGRRAPVAAWLVVCAAAGLRSRASAAGAAGRSKPKELGA